MLFRYLKSIIVIESVLNNFTQQQFLTWDPKIISENQWYNSGRFIIITGPLFSYFTTKFERTAIDFFVSQ